MILVPGQSCWRKERATRIALLVDGAQYFEALLDAMRRARRSIRILGWDIHSQLRLRRDDNKQDGELPGALAPLLRALVRRRRELRVEILVWDSAMIYALEREPLPALRLGWSTPRRITFHLDGNHPLGASHHQKVVLIDDRLAFVGGIDLTEHRWDTPAHAPEDPRRRTWRGEPYGPFHDLELAVEGPVAGALGELFRERWRRATGRRLAPVEAPSDPWPAGLRPDLEDVEVAVVRTEPAWEGRPAVREAERLYLDAIVAAQRSIYIENQYLTSAVVAEGLARSLEAERGPEVLAIGPRRCSGWLEQASMGVLRARVLERLRRSDRHGRLRVLYPVVEGQEVNVHAKALVVDDRLLRVGSANLSNRSMGLDTECDLAIERPGGDAALVGLRDRLLAEHLGCEPAELGAGGSLIEAVDRLRRRPSPRTLRELEPDVPEWLDEVVPEAEVVDPERPLRYDDLVASVVPEDLRRGGSAPVLARLGLWVALCGALLAWRWSAPAGTLPALLSAGAALPGWIAALAAVLGQIPLAPLPRSLRVGAAVLLLGVMPGAPLALCGVVAAGLALYGLGRLVRRRRLRRLTRLPLDQLGHRVAAARVGQLTKTRLLPLTPIWLVDLAAGAWGLAPWRFVTSLVLGELPGALLAVAVAAQLRALLLSGGWLDGALLAAELAALAGLLVWLHRRIHGAGPQVVDVRR